MHQTMRATDHGICHTKRSQLNKASVTAVTPSQRHPTTRSLRAHVAKQSPILLFTLPNPKLVSGFHLERNQGNGLKRYSPLGMGLCVASCQGSSPSSHAACISLGHRLSVSEGSVFQSLYPISLRCGAPPCK
jgi:hypothetical protein